MSAAALPTPESILAGIRDTFASALRPDPEARHHRMERPVPRPLARLGRRARPVAHVAHSIRASTGIRFLVAIPYPRETFPVNDLISSTIT